MINNSKGNTKDKGSDIGNDNDSNSNIIVITTINSYYFYIITIITNNNNYNRVEWLVGGSSGMDIFYSKNHIYKDFIH